MSEPIFIKLDEPDGKERLYECEFQDIQSNIVTAKVIRALVKDDDRQEWAFKKEGDLISAQAKYCYFSKE